MGWNPHHERVENFLISADGQRVFSGSADGTVKMWDTVTGQEKFTIKGHTKRVETVVMSADGPDNKMLAVPTVRGTIVVADIDTGAVRSWEHGFGQLSRPVLLFGRDSTKTIQGLLPGYFQLVSKWTTRSAPSKRTSKKFRQPALPRIG